MCDENFEHPGSQQGGHFDTSEQIQMTGIALLKMLKNAHNGIPTEVFGLVLGSFIDDYTVCVDDIFPIPQTSTISVDDPHRIKMCSLLEKIGHTHEVIGWYKSHPGTGVWRSGVEVNTQMQWEKINNRYIAIVIDPIQSVKGKVAIGAYRCFAQYPSQS